MRAFTKLFDENHREVAQPLFSDTYLSSPLRTHAGEETLQIPSIKSKHEALLEPSPHVSFLLEPLGGVVEGLSAGMFLIGMMVAVVSLVAYRQRLRKV